jgi:hypothetical protein
MLPSWPDEVAPVSDNRQECRQFAQRCLPTLSLKPPCPTPSRASFTRWKFSAIILTTDLRIADLRGDITSERRTSVAVKRIATESGNITAQIALAWTLFGPAVATTFQVGLLSAILVSVHCHSE